MFALARPSVELLNFANVFVEAAEIC